MSDYDGARQDEAEVTAESAVEVEETPEAKAERLRVETIMVLARKRFKTCVDGWAHYRSQAILDAKFRAGTWKERSFQWPDGVQEQRQQEERPCVTVNRMPAFIRQITNAARAARLRIRVVPVDDQSDPKTAEALQGIIRNIEMTSFADRAYSMAADKQAEQGLGFIGLVTEFSNETDFKQRIRIKRKLNPLGIYVDPAVQEADYSDAEYGFEVADLDRATYKDLYGKDAPAPTCLATYEDEGDATGDWFPNGKVRVARYVCRERGPRKRIAELSDGTTIQNFRGKEHADELLKLDPPVYVVRDRFVQPKKMVLRVIDAVNIIEESEWPADSIPWIPMLGDELLIDGERDNRGVVRDSKGSGQAYNVQVSAMIEAVGRGQKATVLGYLGQFGAKDSPQRKAWETAHKRPVPFLEASLLDIDGKPAPLPREVSFEADTHNIVIALQQTDNDYKITAGFNDASLGERGPQESGKAIRLRQDQDTLGSSHYLDNHRFALVALGRQLIQLIRRVLDVPTVHRILGIDNKPKKVMVFSGQERDPRAPQFQTPDGEPWQLPDGVDGIFDLSVGEFDVEVSPGPQHGSRRQEIAEQIGELIGKLPPQVGVNFLDIFFKMLDFAESAEMAARAEQMLPPEMRKQKDGQAPLSPEAQAQIAQLQAQLAQVMQAAQQMQQQIATDEAKQRAQVVMKQNELASKERIENAKMRLTLIEHQTDLIGEKALAVLQGEIDKQLLAAEAANARSLESLKHTHTVEEMVVADHLAPEPAPAAEGGTSA